MPKFLTRDDFVRAGACGEGIESFCRENGLESHTAIAQELLIRMAPNSDYVLKVLMLVGDGNGNGYGYGYGYGYGDGYGNGYGYGNGNGYGYGDGDGDGYRN